MCVMSMVHDHFDGQFPPFGGIGKFPWNTPIPDPAEIARLEKVIQDFREAQEAAKKLDTLMKQPDCVDPVKEQLQKRVAELEAQLKAIREALK